MTTLVPDVTPLTQYKVRVVYIRDGDQKTYVGVHPSRNASFAITEAKRFVTEYLRPQQMIEASLDPTSLV